MTMDAETTRGRVQAGYAEIARKQAGCCGSRTAASANACVGDDYRKLEGYEPDADLGLGCGIPTATAGIQKGMTVLDLGSGAGNDVFVARRETGSAGYVIGVDFTPEMVERAEANRAKLGYENVEFRQGSIEALPVDDTSVDVVISNCVLNLVPDKVKAFSEMFRVLRPGGHFSVSDIVLEGELPAGARQSLEFLVGCVAGAIQKEEYLDGIRSAGFEPVEVSLERPIVFSGEDLRRQLGEEDARQFESGRIRILSVTVKGLKPATPGGSSDPVPEHRG